VFRLLMRRYPSAVPAGEIAAALRLRQNTASGYLKALSTAGLIHAQRDGTHLRYSVVIGGAQDLMQGLFAECCQGRPDLCLPSAAPAPDLPHVLFVCSGNSARSLMAEALLTQLGAGRFHVSSAGTEPAGQPHPKVLDLLASQGLPTAQLRSKPTGPFTAPDARTLDFVVTMCDAAANQDSPRWPGQPLRAHWGVPDPARASSARAYQDAFAQIKRRITAFTALPLHALGRLSLQHALDDIGRLTLDPSQP